MEKMYQQGVMRTKVEDCQFVCVAQSDYYKILHQGEESIKRHEENGKLSHVTETRAVDSAGSKSHVIIRVRFLKHNFYLVDMNYGPLSGDLCIPLFLKMS